MPIAFPPQDRGAPWVAASAVVQFTQQWDITNLGGVGVEFNNLADALDPGKPVDLQTAGQGVNLRNPGFMFESPDIADRFGPWGIDRFLPVPADGAWIAQTDWAASNRQIVGVSRDSTGAVLGTCALDLFTTGSDQVAQSVVSDASGNFAFGNPGTGPFYILAYLAGSPDVAGATVNTLMPALV